MRNLRDTIEDAANRWMQAWVYRDQAVLERSLAPDFVLIVSAFPTEQLDRASWLATACTRYTASQFYYEDVQVRDLGGGIAVMSAIAQFEAEVDGVPRNGPLFVVDVWRQNDEGAWQVCARYSSSPESTGNSARALAALSPD